MNVFQYGHAHAEQWQDAADDCLNQLGTFDPQANLGFLYVTDLLSKELPDILAYFKRQTDVEQWVGTVGIGISSQGIEYFDQPAIAVMLGEFPENSFRVFTNIEDELKEFARTHQAWCDTKQAMFAVVHGDPQHDKISNLVYQLSEQLDEGFLVGGLTSSRHEYSQIANSVTQGKISGALFSSVVPVAVRLTQGCSVIGPRHQITECESNIIVKIDERPALDVFFEDIGEDLADNLNKIAGYIFAALPIQGSDTGDYLVRNLVGIDLKHKLVAIAEPVKPGTTIMFTKRDADSAYADLVKMLTRLKNTLKEPPKGGLYYSCLGRGENLFGSDSQELKTIQRVLGDFPLVGFFANGEIYHQRLYGYTGVLTLFL